jgi:hypothetical protein
LSKIAGAIVAAAVMCSGCFGTPGTTVTSAAGAVYTAGAQRDTVSARLPKSPAQVYSGINKLIAEEPGAEVTHRNDRTYMVEVSWSGRSMAVQAQDLGPSETLLFMWVDGGDTGLTGEEVATSVLRALCDNLGVEYKLVEY